MRLTGMSEIDGGIGVLERESAEQPHPDEPRRRRPTRRQSVAVAGAALVALIAVAFAVGGSSGGESGGASGGASSGSGTPANATTGLKSAPQPSPIVAGAAGGGTATGSVGSATPDRAVAAAPAQAGSTATGVPSVVPPEPGAKVVKTGEMDLQVTKGQVGHILDRLTAIATLERGYVADTHSSEGSDASGAVTLRVPAAAFETTLGEVRKLPVKVLSVQVSGQDVTSQYVDLKARLAALVETRSAFERLLRRATTIGDTLDVQSRITDLQTQIEQLQGQIRVLDDQTGYGTLTVTVDENPKPVPVAAHHRSGMSAAVHRSVTRFVNGIEAIVGVLGPILLVLVVVAVLLGLGRLGYRLLRRQPA